MAYDLGDTLVRAVMTSVTGLPSDQIVNDFAFKAPGTPTSGELDDMFDRVSDFYRLDVASGLNVSEYIGQFVSRAATHELQAYKIQAGPLGSPIATEAWLGPQAPQAADANLPTEVAGVLSFHADLTGILEESGATRPRARRRGRVYIGPLIEAAVTTEDDVPVLRTAFRQTMQSAAVRLKTDALADSSPWCVWSRADAVLRPVYAGWTDNAPDTQRRRGQESTSRSVWGP